MYELPTLTGVSRCVVDDESILTTNCVHLVREDGKVMPLPLWEQKSA